MVKSKLDKNKTVRTDQSTDCLTLHTHQKGVCFIIVSLFGVVVKH